MMGMIVTIMNPCQFHFVEATDLINQLDIADGLKELLLSSSFTLKSLQNASVSDLAKTLGIDEHIAKLVSDAVNKAIKRSIP